MKLKILLFALSIFFMNNAIFSQQIPPDDNKLQFRSLQWLYESIENSNKSSLLQNWDFSDSVNINFTNWEGITLDANGYIIEIDISEKGLIAEFEVGSQNRFCLVYLSKLKSVNFSNNEFSGAFPALQHVDNSSSQTTVYNLLDLEIININNNLFKGSISIPNNSGVHPNTMWGKIKEFRASNNRLDYINVNNSPYIEILDLSENLFGLGDFHILWPDNLELRLDTLDIRNNRLRFNNLWRFSNPGNYILSSIPDVEDYRDTTWEIGYRRIFHDPQINILYMPQDSVPMNTVYNRRVRALIGDSIAVKVPNAGQDDERYTEIKDSLSYQWYHEGIALVNDTLSCLIRENINSNDYGLYHCRISYKGERLRGLILNTETFEIVNEANQLPAIYIDNGIPQSQRLRKGNTSNITKLKVADDLPLGFEGSFFKVSKFPKHLKLENGYPSSIQVKDTSSALWTGLDTVEVTYCDFEGGCTNFQLYYEVYDDLYAPPIDTVWVTENKEMILKWNPDFYDMKIEKPDGYYILVDTSSMSGTGNFFLVDSIPLTEMNTNHASIAIPESGSEYFFRLRLYAQKGNIASAQPSLIYVPMPIKPDTNLQASIQAGDVQLNWLSTGIQVPFPITGSNLIYRSEDSIHYVAIGKTVLDQNSFIDTSVLENRTYWYKLTKLAASFTSIPMLEFVLPYLESDVVKISTGNIITVIGITLDEHTLSLKVDSTETLLATITPNNAPNRNVSWASRDENIATVDNNGLVKGIAVGNTYIVVTTQDGNFQDSCLVTVSEDSDIAVTGVTLNKRTLSLKVDSTETLTATITPNNATNQNKTWQSRDESIATVDNNGLVTAIAEGEAFIVVTTADGGFKDSCLVTVEANVGISDIENQATTFKIYPNPTSGKLIIENEDTTTQTAELFDLNGRLISTLKISGKKTEIDISRLPNGTYLIKLGNVSTKVVKH